TAEWVGWGHRTDIKKATRLRTILASTDPIALDYYAAKQLIYPISKKSELHDPDNPKSVIRKFLNLASYTIGESTIFDNNISVYKFDFV
ncbi:MAG: hypothetical protein ACTSQP_20295, partial [Promethearchaeota archaeon]